MSQGLNLKICLNGIFAGKCRLHFCRKLLVLSLWGCLRLYEGSLPPEPEYFRVSRLQLGDWRFFLSFLALSLLFTFIEIREAPARQSPRSARTSPKPPPSSDNFCFVWSKMTTLHTHQAITAISFIENINTVVNTILCRVQPSNKRRPRIGAALEVWKFINPRGAYSVNTVQEKRSGVSGQAFANVPIWDQELDLTLLQRKDRIWGSGKVLATVNKGGKQFKDFNSAHVWTNPIKNSKIRPCL